MHGLASDVGPVPSLPWEEHAVELQGLLDLRDVPVPALVGPLDLALVVQGRVALDEAAALRGDALLEPSGEYANWLM